MGERNAEVLIVGGGVGGCAAALAVFASLVVARVLTPMMAAYLLKAARQLAAHEPRWVTTYLGWASWCLRQGLVAAGQLPLPPAAAALVAAVAAYRVWLAEGGAAHDLEQPGPCQRPIPQLLAVFP